MSHMKITLIVIEELKLLNMLLRKQHYQATGLVKEKYF